MSRGRGRFHGQESCKEDVEKDREEIRTEGGAAEAAQDRTIREPFVGLSDQRGQQIARGRARRYPARSSNAW